MATDREDAIPAVDWRRRRWRRLRRLRRWHGLPWQYASSIAGAYRHRSTLAGVERFCVFVGHPRAGKSLLRALLNAHPQVVLSDELDVLRYVQLGFRRSQIYALILRSEAQYTRHQSSTATGDFVVDGQWQGRSDGLRVIGDNKGGATALLVRRRPEIVERLARVVTDPICYLHVLRNPFDVISGIYLNKSWIQPLDAAVDVYQLMCEGVDQVRARVAAGAMLDLRHEELLDDPASQLVTVCGFLGLDPDPSWLNACAAAVYRTPQLPRTQVPWTVELRSRVEDLIDRRGVLAGYTWDA